MGVEPTPVPLLRRLALPVGLSGGGEAGKFEPPNPCLSNKEVYLFRSQEGYLLYFRFEMNPGSKSINNPHRGVIFLLGLSGSGKGTVARHLLEEKLTSLHLSMGDLLRNLIDSVEQDPTTQPYVEALLKGDPPQPGFTKLAWLQHCVQKGLLVPDAWTQAIIEHQLAYTPALSLQPWSMDGYPRRIGAAQHLLQTLERLQIPVWAVVHLEVSEAEAMRRLLARGRADDTPNAILERFAFFKDNVLPTLEYLEHQLGSDRVLHIHTESPGPSRITAAEVVYARVRSKLLALT